MELPTQAGLAEILQGLGRTTTPERLLEPSPFLVRGHGRGARTRRLCADVDELCAGVDELHDSRFDGGVVGELAAVRERVGRQVDDAHPERQVMTACARVLVHR